MLAIGLLFVGIVARLAAHTPNFTPVIALALFSGVYVNRKYAVVLPLSLMVITDLFLGIHATVLFTWGCVALIAANGLLIANKKSVKTIAVSSFSSAILFFVVTNFGVWMLSGLYAPTFEGLVKCYTMAVPFFRTMLFSTAIYAVVFFGVYELVSLKVKKTKFANVLL